MSTYPPPPIETAPTVEPVSAPPIPPPPHPILPFPHDACTSPVVVAVP